MADRDEGAGTVEVRLRFWRNRAPSGEGGHRESGDYLPTGLVWPAGTVYVPKQEHAPNGPADRMVNHPFEWMGAIQAALKDAGVKMVPPKYEP
jgi:hypothetical protein